jgi:hypothetical protein
MAFLMFSLLDLLVLPSVRPAGVSKVLSSLFGVVLGFCNVRAVGL